MWAKGGGIIYISIRLITGVPAILTLQHGDELNKIVIDERKFNEKIIEKEIFGKSFIRIKLKRYKYNTYFIPVSNIHSVIVNNSHVKP